MSPRPDFSTDNLFAIAFRNAASGMAITDREGRFLQANTYLCEFLGYSEAELLRLSLNDLAVSEETTVFSSYVERLSAGEAFHMERRYRHKSGRTEWGLHSVSRVSSDGDLFLSQIQEITAFKQVEEELRESEERLQLAFSAMAESIVILYADGSCQMNENAGRLLAQSRISSSHLLDDLTLHDGQGRLLPAEENPFSYTMRTGKPLTDQVVGLPGAGGMQWLLTNTRPIFDKDSRHVSGAVVSFRDVTERRRLEEQLRHSQRMESVGRLAGGMAHDFNNLLTAILGEATLRLQDASMPERARKSFDSIAASARRGASLTNKLLTFSSNRQGVGMQTIDLLAVVESLQDVLQRLLSGRVACEVSGEPRCYVTADRQMVEQVLMNLAVNANHAMPEGGRLSIHTGLVRFSEEDCMNAPERCSGAHVCLTVGDTGTGMDADTVARIFEPYFTTKPAGKGTGLGLSIVYGIVRQHGGWIEVSSRLGEGAQFRVYFPQAAAPTAPSARPAETRLRRAQGHGQGILVAEDDADIRELLYTILSEDGFRVFPARSGVEALKVFAQESGQIAMLLTDVLLEPEMNGFELAERIRAQAPGIEILYASGYQEKPPPEGTALIEGENFLLKPYEIEGLLQAVRRRFT